MEVAAVAGWVSKAEAKHRGETRESEQAMGRGVARPVSSGTVYEVEIQILDARCHYCC